MDRSYDARNRLIALGFPDGNGSQSRHYTADGLPSSVVTANDAGASSVTNSYLYNKRRLLVGETQAQTGGTAWSTGYGYSGNGHLASLSYPAGLRGRSCPRRTIFWRRWRPRTRSKRYCWPAPVPLRPGTARMGAECNPESPP